MNHLENNKTPIGVFFPLRGKPRNLCVEGVALTYSVPFRGLQDLIKISSTNADTKQTMNRIKSRLNYPEWQASGIMGLVILSVLFFTIRTL